MVNTNAEIVCHAWRLLSEINRPFLDLETDAAETKDLITVLDDDVTELDVLVSTLQEENAQLQQTVSQLQMTVNFLLKHFAALEVTDAITNNTLDGNVVCLLYTFYG